MQQRADLMDSLGMSADGRGRGGGEGRRRALSEGKIMKSDDGDVRNECLGYYQPGEIMLYAG